MNSVASLFDDHRINMSIGLGSDFDLAESQTQLLTEGPSGESDIMAREATITHVSTSEDRVLQTSQEVRNRSSSIATLLTR